MAIGFPRFTCRFRISRPGYWTPGQTGWPLNRFYQADIDLEKLEAVHQLELSTSSDPLLRLRWLAVLSAQTDRTLAVSGGVHSAPDALKAVLAGLMGCRSYPKF